MEKLQLMKELLVASGVSSAKVAEMSEKQLEAACKERNIQIQSGLNNDANWGKIGDGFAGSSQQVQEPRGEWSDKKLKYYNNILEYLGADSNSAVAKHIENMSAKELKELYKYIQKNDITLDMFESVGADMTFPHREVSKEADGFTTKEADGVTAKEVKKIAKSLEFEAKKEITPDMFESVGADMTFPHREVPSGLEEKTLEPEDEAKFKQLRKIVELDAAAGSGHIIPDNMIKEYIILDKAVKNISGGDGYTMSDKDVERYKYLQELINEAAKNIVE